MQDTTGQLFIRETGQVINGKKIYMTFGIIAVDADAPAPFLGEHQYTIQNLNLADPIDQKMTARGMSACNLLTMPIWRF